MLCIYLEPQIVTLEWFLSVCLIQWWSDLPYYPPNRMFEKFVDEHHSSINLQDFQSCFVWWSDFLVPNIYLVSALCSPIWTLALYFYFNNFCCKWIQAGPSPIQPTLVVRSWLLNKIICKYKVNLSRSIVECTALIRYWGTVNNIRQLLHNSLWNLQSLYVNNESSLPFTIFQNDNNFVLTYSRLLLSSFLFAICIICEQFNDHVLKRSSGTVVPLTQGSGDTVHLRNLDTFWSVSYNYLLFQVLNKYRLIFVKQNMKLDTCKISIDIIFKTFWPILLTR